MRVAVFFAALLSIAIYRTEAKCHQSQTIARGSHAPAKTTFCSGDLIFEDNFNDFDLNKWKHESTLAGGGNWEFQWYTNSRTNSYVEKGLLKIKPSLTSHDLGEAALYSQTLDLNRRAEGCTNANSNGCVRTGNNINILNPVKSARISTIDSFTFRYGRVEVNAKLPKGDWLWPAIWLLPKDSLYGAWPASGEIDILESRGNEHLKQNGVNIGPYQMNSGLHWGPSWDHDRFAQTRGDRSSKKGYHSDFHVYGVTWSPESIIFTVDGSKVLTVTPPAGGFWEKGQFGSTGKANPWKGGAKMAPFDREFYLIMNLAVGGTNQYFPDNVSNPGGKPWVNNSPKAATDFWNGRNSWLPTWNLGTDSSAFQVDYIRVYAL